MLLVQISDLHCGPQFQPEVFEVATDEINSLNPDALIVLGDLTEDGLLAEFQMAKKELNKFHAKNLIVCSGNHDYRSTGYLLFQKFFPFKQVTEIEDAVIVLLSSARPDRDDGEVGHRQNIWLRQTLSKYHDRYKIVAIHHHLVPVPDTGLDLITVVDAGDVLLSLNHAKVNLVLCGHRHRPWRWHLEKFSIVHSGTVSSKRFRGFFKNSYNIINIEERKVDVKLKIVGGETIKFDKIIAGKANVGGV
jgi:Icc protein